MCWRRLATTGVLSKRLQHAATRYSTFGRELLAVYLSIKHFRHLLEGRSSTVYTDHKPLTHALHAQPDRYSPREVRQLDFISQFTAELRHISGKKNAAADALSRHINTLQDTTVIDYDAIAQAQEDDDEIPQLADDPLKLEKVPIPSSERTILCDMSTGFRRPYVPVSFRKSIFHSLHNLSHPGITATQKLITDRCVEWHQPGCTQWRHQGGGGGAWGAFAPPPPPVRGFAPPPTCPPSQNGIFFFFFFLLMTVSHTSHQFKINISIFCNISFYK